MSPVWKRFLSALPLLALEAGAAVSPVKVVQTTPPVETSIPYPGGGVYLSRGIYASLAGGQYEGGEAQSLYQWQGEAGYYYTSWFSGGVGFKMIAGQPSDSIQTIKNRFFVVGRFHKAWSRVSGYVGTQIGVDDLNISLTPLDSGNFRQPLRKTSAGLGVEFGLGWKFSRYVGATFGQRFEASFVGEDTSHFEGALNFRTQPGLAFDVLALAPGLRRNVKAMNVFLETQFGQLVLEDKSKRKDFAWITGISLAF